MDTFDGSKPNLISSKTLDELEANLKNTMSNKEHMTITEGISSFYLNYIEPNLFPIIVVMLLCLYLTLKYMIKNIHNGKGNTFKNKQKLKQKINHVVSPSIYKKNENYDMSELISDDYLLTDMTDITDVTDVADMADVADVNDTTDDTDSNSTYLEYSRPLHTNKKNISDKDKGASLVFGK